MTVMNFLDLLDDDCKVIIHFSFGKDNKYVGASCDVFFGDPTMVNLRNNLACPLLMATVDTVSALGGNSISIHASIA